MSSITDVRNYPYIRLGSKSVLWKRTVSTYYGFWSILEETSSFGILKKAGATSKKYQDRRRGAEPTRAFDSLARRQLHRSLIEQVNVRPSRAASDGNIAYSLYLLI